MDVGDPSNVEQLRFPYSDRATMGARLRTAAIGDDLIRNSIPNEYLLARPAGRVAIDGGLDALGERLPTA